MLQLSALFSRLGSPPAQRAASSRPTQRKKTSLKPTTATGTAGSDVAAAAENTTATTTTATGEAGILVQARPQVGMAAAAAAADCPRLMNGPVHSRIFAAATTLIPAAPIAIGTAPPAPTAAGQGSSTSAHTKKAPTKHVAGPSQKLGTSEHVRPSHQQRSCHHPLEG